MKRPWICPKCGRVYAPHVSQCFYCNNKVADKEKYAPLEPYPNPWPRPKRPWTPETFPEPRRRKPPLWLKDYYLN